MWSQGQVHAAHRGKRKQVGSSYLGIWSGNWYTLIGHVFGMFLDALTKKIDINVEIQWGLVIFLVDIGLALYICDLGFMKVSYIVYNYKL